MSICKNQNKKKIKDDRQFYLYATPSPIPSLRVEFSSIREQSRVDPYRFMNPGPNVGKKPTIKVIQSIDALRISGVETMKKIVRMQNLSR